MDGITQENGREKLKGDKQEWDLGSKAGSENK